MPISVLPFLPFHSFRLSTFSFSLIYTHQAHQVPLDEISSNLSACLKKQINIKPTCFSSDFGLLFYLPQQKERPNEFTYFYRACA